MPNTAVNSRRFFGFSPTTLPNCAIWLDGSDSSTITLGTGTRVTQWADKSGGGRNATRADNTNNPSYTAGTNYLQFTADGTSSTSSLTGWNYLDCTGLSVLGGTQGFTLFFVIRRDSNKNNSTTSGSYLTGGTSSTTNQRLHCGYYYSVTAPASDRLTMRYQSNDFDNVALNFATNEPPKVLRFRHTSANARTMAINGFTVQSDTPANGFLSTTYPGACIGAREPPAVVVTPNNGFNGRIYEVIGFNRGLSDNESRQIESYLGWKYQILQPGPLVTGYGPSFNPTSIPNCTLWLDAADTSTLFTNRAGTARVSASGDNVRRWNDKSATGTHALDLVGSSSIFPKYQFGGVYIFNQNSNNDNSATRCAMQIQSQVQGTAVNYSVIAVIDFLNAGTASLQTIYSNSRSGAINESRAPHFGAGNSFETNTTGGVGMSIAGAFPGTGRRVMELISSGGITAGASSANTLSYFNQGATTTTGVGTGTFVKWSGDAGPLPTIGIGVTNAAGGTYDNRLANGTFYELIVYTRAITNAERAQLLSYLSRKWKLNVVPNAFPGFYPYVQIPTSFRYFSPIDIPSCSLWLDALDSSTFTPANPSNGAAITAWADKSPSGRNASSAGGTVSYGSTALNSRPGLFLLGGAYMTGTASNTTTEVTGFVVGTMENTSANDARMLSLGQTGQADFNSVLRTPFIIRNGTANQIRTFRNSTSLGLISFTYSLPFIASSTFTGSSNTIYRDGNAGTTVASSGNFGYSNYGIGRDPGTTTAAILDGIVSEVILYNAALSLPEIQEVEGYLAWKWGLATSLVSGHPYRINSPARSVFPTFPKFQPTDFSNCVYWIDSSDPETVEFNVTPEVLSLLDKSSNSYMHTNAVFFAYDTTSRKFTNTTYANAVIGTNSSVSIATPFTVFWVAQRAEATTGRFSLDGTGATNRIRIQDSGGNYVTTNITASGVATNTAGIFSSRFGTSPNFCTNGTFASVTTSASTFTAAGISVGCDYTLNNSWWGDIAEVVILTNETEDQRIAMEGYLAQKWGYTNLLPSQHPFRDILN